MTRHLSSNYIASGVTVLTHWGCDKMVAIWRTDIFKRVLLNENIRISTKISLIFVPKGAIDNRPALVQIMAWHWTGDKPLSEPRMESLLTHICVTRPQWVNTFRPRQNNRHFARDIFRDIYFLKWKSLHIDSDLNEICSRGPNLH